MPNHAIANVAIVLSGAYRTLPDCNASMVRHVIHANPTMRFHVYAHVTAEAVGVDAHARRDVWDTFPCVVGAAVETNAAVTASVNADMSGIQKLPRGRGTAQGKAMNIIKMFRGIGVAQQLLSAGGHVTPKSDARGPPGLLVPPAGHGSRCDGPLRAPKSGYDLVLRLRPDLCFCGPLDLTSLLPLRPEKPHLWLPWWSAKIGWAFDQIAVGAPATMAAYAQAYQTTVPRLVRAQAELYPEAVMWAHLTSLGLGAPGRLLRPLRGFQASLARNAPRFHLVDPFSKLKQDMMVEASTEVLPPYVCHDDAVALHNRSSGHARGRRRTAPPSDGQPRRYRRRRQRHS